LPRLTVAVAIFALLVSACRASPSPSARSAGARSAADWFVNRARETGLDFVHFNGMSGEKYYPEIMAPGVALLDYDNDGDLDVYIVQGQMLGKGRTLADATYKPAGELKDRLFRNDLTVAPDGTRTLRFVDVTDQAHIDVRSYGMGVAVGDIDNDGRVDIYRTGLSGSVMLHNNGDGTFTDVTARTGTGNAGGWGVSATFVDYDGDGWLDLYVGNYLQYSIEGDIHCVSLAGERDYCPPNYYHAQQDRVYRNKGNGTFEDVTRRALTGGAGGPALGVVARDFNGDGWPDVYVANDGEANQLWINQKNGTFKDMAFLDGVAVSGGGNAEASMGIAAGDFDNDGDDDLFVTNWASQMNVLYLNTGGGVFEDHRAASGLGAPSLARTGFGTGWIDYDNDGWLDLLTVNGGVAAIEEQVRAKDPFPLRMPMQLYRNSGSGAFEEVSSRAGKVFMGKQVSRGAAFGDIDNDGDMDVVVGNAAGPVELLVNEVGNRNHWLGVRLVGREGRDALGARVEVVRDGGAALWRTAQADGSYASANDPRVLAGLGGSAAPVTVRVTWPTAGRKGPPHVPGDNAGRPFTGRQEQWTGIQTDRWITLREGTGR
jgi:hypothetical protein